jgi:thioredoxin reductase (NADPH)
LSDAKKTGSGASHDVVVIGAGVAGLSVASEAARLGLTTALFDDGLLGGLVTNIGALEGPPDHEGEAGADFVTTLLGDALETGVDYQMGEITNLSTEDGVWRLSDDSVTARTVVLATGAAFRTLDVPGEERLMGRGVSQCAFCDGGLYRGKDVAVIGGGDSAFQEAQHLAELCANVTIVLRSDAPRARPGFISELSKHDNVRIRPNLLVREIMGGDGVEAVRLFDPANEQEEILSLEAVFPFIGLAPRTSLAPDSAARDDAGALIVERDLQTRQLGLYAVGAARAGYGGAIAHILEDARTVAQAIKNEVTA